MLNLIVLNSLILAALVLIEGSLTAFWMGDFILVFIYFWFLKYHFSLREARENGLLFWLPIVLGLSIFNFKIDSLWMILPYFFIGAATRNIFIWRSEWIFRAKEGFLILLSSVAFFAFLKIIIQQFVLGYDIGRDFWLRMTISFLMVFGIWFYYYKQENAKKIR